MQRVRTGSKQLIREINQTIVLNVVREQGLASRSQIAVATGLSPATVSGITGQLIANGLLRERATGKSAGGRRPVLLQLNAAAGYAVGVKVTESAVIAVLTDLDATIIARQRLTLDRHDVDDVLDAVEEVSSRLILDAADRPVYGVGVGLAGIVDSHNGVVHHAPYCDWREIPLARLLEDRLDLPVIIDNDANTLTATEQWFGAGRSVSNFLVVCLGHGVGLGMVLDGQLFRGANGGAGEFGHVQVKPSGSTCACGASGCLESVVSDSAISSEVSCRIGRRVTIGEAAELARSGERAALDVFLEAARILGVATANLVNILNPDLIVVSGEGTQAGDIIQEEFEASLRLHCFGSLGDNLRVVIKPWSDEAWARGAASLLLGQLFEAPTSRPMNSRRPALVTRSM
jgi:predicted NBD/HSP70 family sugar kinase